MKEKGCYETDHQPARLHRAEPTKRWVGTKSASPSNRSSSVGHNVVTVLAANFCALDII